VDDDPLSRKLTVTALTYCVNREVFGFEDACKAWDYIEKGGDVDIIISDADMPVINGFDLMSRVRKKNSNVIFIMMSGISAYEDRARREGASAFLAKPFEIKDLFNIVRHFIVEEHHV
jgi:CheY-like chemotaxis protein